MKIHNVAQGSAEWLALRAGVPTASEFKRIVTPTGKLSKQSDEYMFALLAEWMVGHPFVGEQTQWMERGTLLEEEAVRVYSFHMDIEPEVVGFVTNDEMTVGASPDRLVGENRLLEIKCPKHTTHVGYMLTKSVEDEYLPQLQGQLWITERESVDIVSYHPEMAEVIINVPRDEAFIAKLKSAVGEFVEIMLTKRNELETKYGPFIRVKKDADANPFEITDADVNAIWEASIRLREVEAMTI